MKNGKLHLAFCLTPCISLYLLYISFQSNEKTQIERQQSKLYGLSSPKKERGRVCANWVFNSIPTFSQRAAVFGGANISTTLLGSVTQKDLTKTFFGSLSLQTRPVSQVRLASSAKVFVKAAYFSLFALNLRIFMVIP